MAFNLFGKSKKLEAELADMRSQLSEIKNKAVIWGGQDFSEFFGPFAASSGVAVTADTAKRSSAVYACTSLIAGAIALLPLAIYQRNGDTRERVNDHPYWWLLNESPHALLNSASFWEWMAASMLLRRDGIARIIRGPRYEAIGFEPIDRRSVQIAQLRDEKTFEPVGLFYQINDGRRSFVLDQADVLHFPGFGFNGIHGESVIEYAAKQAIGTALAADEFSGEFFANGANPSAVITFPLGGGPVTPEQKDYLRKQIDERHTGTGNRHRPFVLSDGGKLESITLSPTDSQLLETRKFQVIDIARAFGVPPHMIGETSASTSWGTGIEQMSRGFVRYTLGPHLQRIEQELNRKLWPTRSKYFIEFNRDGLNAGDSKTEAEYFGKALGGPGAQGWTTVNEIRRIKNLPPDPNPLCNQVTIATQQGAKNEPGTTVPTEPNQDA